jgi:hypothetical protein
VVVLVEDVQGDVRRHDMRGDQPRRLHHDPIVQVDLVGGLRGPAVDGDETLLDELLHQRAGVLGETLVHVEVEPLERGLLVDLEFVPRDAVVIDLDRLGHATRLAGAAADARAPARNFCLNPPRAGL